MRGKASAKLAGRSGIARHGNRSLFIQMPPSGDEGRHSLIMTWRFDKPADWSAYEGLSLWVQTHGDPPPRVAPSLTEAGGARYWVKAMPIAPRKEGEWQLIELPFKNWTWCWEAKKDDNNQLDLDQVKCLQFEIRAFKDAPLTLGLDGLGLYAAKPAYTGPVLRFRPAKKEPWPFVCAPGQEHRVVVEVRRLTPGQRAEVEVVGTDYWGKRRIERKLTFEGKNTREERHQQEISFRNDGPDYVGLTGTLSVDGRLFYRAEGGVACIKPMDPQDAKPNDKSIFGIWVGGGGEKIGAKWTRILARITNVTKVAGQYKLGDAPLGVPRPKWGWRREGAKPIVCFVSMAKWLSSKPDRADFQKWSPKSWKEYGKVVEFHVRGAKEAGIRHYEVWNEPVPYAGWMGPMESVVKLHKVTYEAIKKVQPDAVVLGPCPYTFKWDFLEKFFELGGGKWIDQVVIHAYDSAPPDVNFTANLRKLRDLLGHFGLGDRDIYITEMGYATPNVTERRQAQYLVRAYVYALSEGVRVLVWHMLWDWRGVRDPEHYVGDPGHAIQRFDKSPRPAYVAYATMTRMLKKARYMGPVEGMTKTQRGFAFTRRGKRIYVLWNVGDKPTRFALRDPAENMMVVHIVGDETMIRPAEPGRFDLTLGPDPIYVTSW
ncbi:MAG: hypothetical protein GXP25_00295 [Planctomycetes bacterium]|nr:hypothetical protein [Planctomycetota bacterium]